MRDVSDRVEKAKNANDVVHCITGLIWQIYYKDLRDYSNKFYQY